MKLLIENFYETPVVTSAVFSVRRLSNKEVHSYQLLINTRDRYVGFSPHSNHVDLRDDDNATIARVSICGFDEKCVRYDHQEKDQIAVIWIPVKFGDEEILAEAESPVTQ